MKIADFEIIDLALWFANEKILVIGDLHIGYEEMLNKEGVLVPLNQFEMTMDRLEKTLKKTGKADKIVINGDLKHEFGIISDTEWKQSLAITDFLGKNCNELILVKGNHDTILKQIADRKKLKIAEYYKFGDNLVCHGDKIIDVKAKLIIIGHNHPAVCLRKENRTEMYKCFLFGKWKKSELIVMPSFNLVKEGSDILSSTFLSSKFLSPYLKDISNFNVKIVQDSEVLDFGKVKKLILLHQAWDCCANCTGKCQGNNYVD